MNKKKLWGAIISGLIFIIYFGVLFLLFTFTGIFTGDIPFPIFIIMMTFLFIPLVGIVLALVFRVREINNGEEEESKKY